ncbi:MAG: DUF2508 family protein [Vallitaleaceae bacterium]|nr:DUF2508 family protein [Vallitaleaceae bacterium]
MKNAYNYNNLESDFPRRKFRSDEEEIIYNIERVKDALEMAYAQFNWATEPHMVDSTIYEVNANLLKYEYLLQQAKALGIISNTVEYRCNKDR